MAAEIMYRPEHAGTQVTSKRGNVVKIRKYHMTDVEMQECRDQWLEEIKDVPNALRSLAHSHFFNPFRKGVYYAQVQALYLLGANQWHELSIIVPKVQELMEQREKVYRGPDGSISTGNTWNKYREKTPKSDSIRSKDILGKIQENFIFMQRLTGLHPCGYKVRQVCASIDFKRIQDPNLPSGKWFYRLSTYKTMEESYPVRDYTEFNLEESGRHVTHKFIGKVVTMEKVINQGIEQEISHGK
jgi:hypothetical protein